MYCCDVWRGIDKQEFLESSILLDLKHQCQGTIVKSRNLVQDASRQQSCTNGVYSKETILNFLDDFALVAAGSGAKEKICSVCLDTDNRKGVLILRVAQNDGVSKQNLSVLRNLARLMMVVNDSAIAIYQTRDALLEIILRNCQIKVTNKALTLRNVLKEYQFKSRHQRCIPPWKPMNKTQESRKDVALLGPYSEMSHMKYMKLCEERAKRLEDFLAYFEQNNLDGYMSMLVGLTALTYELHRSSSFKHYVISNLEPLKDVKKQHRILGRALEIMERIGGLSKFFRASLTMTTIGRWLALQFQCLEVQAVPTTRLRIPQLKGRGVDDLRRLGGSRFQQISSSILQSRLNRWNRYREHAEIQLLIFYEEHPESKPYIYYIGCSKLCCYLCYCFVKAHSTFEVCGCHQSLYSLWTIRDKIDFVSDDRARAFQAALDTVCKEVRKRLQLAQKLHVSHRNVVGGNESIANLSRTTLSLSEAISNIKRDSLLRNERIERAKPIDALQHSKTSGSIVSIDEILNYRDTKSLSAADNTTLSTIRSKDMTLSKRSSISRMHVATSLTLGSSITSSKFATVHFRPLLLKRQSIGRRNSKNPLHIGSQIDLRHTPRWGRRNPRKPRRAIFKQCRLSYLEVRRTEIVVRSRKVNQRVNHHHPRTSDNKEIYGFYLREIRQSKPLLLQIFRKVFSRLSINR